MPAEPPRLAGKVAIVTGAGATGSGDFVGIGQAISILFARHGAGVLLVDRDQQNAETTLAAIPFSRNKIPASMAMCTSEPVAMRRIWGLASASQSV